MSSCIQEKDILEILSSLDQVPADQKSAINFNGGGFDNHRIFWNNMKKMVEENQADLSRMQ